jgi:hypothetical protein
MDDHTVIYLPVAGQGVLDKRVPDILYLED